MDWDNKLKTIRALQIWRVDHLPIISTFCRKINLIEIINKIVPTNMDTKPGVIVQAMVLDTLSGRSPLYKLTEFFSEQDTDLLIKPGVCADDFDDTTAGRSMDAMYDAGTMKIFSAVSLAACKSFMVDTTYGHYDTTSVSVWGKYESTIYNDKGIDITYGYSKDHRPDLKQFIIDALCVEKNIPIYGGCRDGNSSDKALNNRLLQVITKEMSQHKIKEEGFIYIADSALVSKDNLEDIGDNKFITRLPARYSICKIIIHHACKVNEWKTIGTLANSSTNKKGEVAEYKGYECEITLYDKQYRAIVIHSSSHEKRRQKRIAREINKDKQSLKKTVKDLLQKKYFCKSDADAAIKSIEEKESKLHTVETEIVEKKIYERGRPCSDGSRKVKNVVYEIEGTIKEKEDAIEQKKLEGGCFVLLTSVPKDGEYCKRMDEVLKLYKDQQGVERNFAFLKDPLIVNDLFLKKSTRIEVLGLILLISLLIWNLIERELRKHVEESGCKMPGWDKKQTNRPTTFMLVCFFSGVMIFGDGEKRALVKSLNLNQLKYLEALGLSESIFKQIEYG